MKVLFQTSLPQSASPYRLIDNGNQAVHWANDYLDAQKMRGLSLCTLRATPTISYTSHVGFKLRRLNSGASTSRCSSITSASR